MSRRPVREVALPAAAAGTDTPKPSDTQRIDDDPPTAVPPPDPDPDSTVKDTATTTGGRSIRRAGGRHPFTPAAPPVVHEPSTTIPANGPTGPIRGLIAVSGRLIVNGPRIRGVSSIDVVEFTAACPACGKEVSWIEEREETRLRIIIECPCGR